MYMYRDVFFFGLSASSVSRGGDRQAWSKAQGAELGHQTNVRHAVACICALLVHIMDILAHAHTELDVHVRAWQKRNRLSISPWCTLCVIYMYLHVNSLYLTQIDVYMFVNYSVDLYGGDQAISVSIGSKEELNSQNKVYYYVYMCMCIFSHPFHTCAL